MSGKLPTCCKQLFHFGPKDAVHGAIVRLVELVDQLPFNLPPGRRRVCLRRQDTTEQLPSGGAEKDLLANLGGKR